MAMKFTLNSRLTEIGDQMPEVIDGALDQYAESVVEQMREAAPVRTGHLRDNIKKDAPAEGGSVQINSEADYSGYVEYGTSRMAARPFFTPPLYEAEKELPAAIAEAIKKAL